MWPYDGWWEVCLVVQPAEPLCGDHAPVVVDARLLVVDDPAVTACETSFSLLKNIHNGTHAMSSSNFRTGNWSIQNTVVIFFC